MQGGLEPGHGQRQLRGGVVLVDQPAEVVDASRWRGMVSMPVNARAMRGVANHPEAPGSSAGAALVVWSTQKCGMGLGGLRPDTR